MVQQCVVQLTGTEQASVIPDCAGTRSLTYTGVRSLACAWLELPPPSRAGCLTASEPPPPRSQSDPIDSPLYVTTAGTSRTVSREPKFLL
ncbi:hypothetical protein M408DRAFT_325779 [Serendipita vermifera MAFF 305830]|uniref:Uncharacterized protein n=1 Tax=Serendipita vermifera MAFF 305830 TaxID=933852 RepID=A0A0C3BSI3_SERVB|nr:hypothetical protein M408DRAFT_325779 [Serendipita vermifera MAFF 305830]